MLAGVLGLALVAGTGIPRVAFDPSTEDVFPEGHPAVATYERFRQAFGSDETIVVAFSVPARADDTAPEDVFSRSALALAREVAGRLRSLEGVEAAYSLADVPTVGRGPRGLPVLLPPLPEDLSAISDADLAAWRARALGMPMVGRVLVSADRRSTAIVALLAPVAPGPAGAQATVDLVERIEAALAESEAAAVAGGGPAGEPRRFLLAGTPRVKVAIVRTIARDVAVFAGPLLGVAVLVALVVLRSFTAAGQILACLAASNAVVVGLLGHLGVALDPMTALVPTLVLVIGVADALHLLVEQRGQAAADPGASGAATIERALAHCLLPCFLTSLTTALGFGSLVTSDIPPIRTFGLAAALGAVVTFAVSITLVPALAALCTAPGRAGAPARPLRLDRLATLVTARPAPALAGGLAVMAVAAAGAVHVRTDTDFLRFFRPETRLVRDALEVGERFVGVAPVEVVARGAPGAAHDPAVLRALWTFARAAEDEAKVDIAWSAADLVARALEVVEGRPRVPDTAEELARVEALVGALARANGGQGPGRAVVPAVGPEAAPDAPGTSPAFEHLVSPPGPAHPGEEWLRVALRISPRGSTEVEALVAHVERLAAAHLAPAGLRFEVTGTTVVFSRTADRILSGQVESFLWAMGTIVLVMIVALRSVRLGLASIVPNLAPIAAILAVLGWAGIPLSSFNSMVASVAIGIAVDDTIHLLTGFRRLAGRLPLREAVHETIAHEGAAVLGTSLVLGAGFSVLLLAEFLPTAQFGLLTATALVAALVGDLVVLPAVLLLVPGLAPVAPPEPTAPPPSEAVPGR